MAFSRRKFLLGLGGAAVGLPFLEGLTAKTARADNAPKPYALFYRRGNGVQQAIFDRNSYPSQGFWTQQQPQEPERWWPMQNASTPYPYGDLATFGPISALNELEAYVSKTTLVRGLRHPYGTENGHPEGAAQGLTGAGLKYPADVPTFQSCLPLGESLDNLIARQLTPAHPESMYMGVMTGGTGGLSWIRQGATVFPRSAEENLLNIFNELFLPYSTPDTVRQLLVNQRKSVNDLVRADIKSLENDPRMSKADQDRLSVHLNAIRETEVALAACVVPGTLQADVQGYNHASITEAVTVIGKLAALAISCGLRQSVLINIGVPQDIINYSEVPGAGGYEFHALSHRQAAENDLTPVAAAQGLHHQIDRYHLKQFRSILDLLSAYPPVNGKSLVDYGVNVHFSDLGSGQHIVSQLPYLYVGGANDKLKTGKYVLEDRQYLVKFLNTIGAAVGCKNSAGNGPLDDLNADNNSYRSSNYCKDYYFQPYVAPIDGKPAITGQLASIMNP
ncbi:MAG TPA: DUF1552 domain-containing protein [Labilithrix sp.]|nr:DUF1552 domain-containing protein [Labilithrix sp.]